MRNSLRSQSAALLLLVGFICLSLNSATAQANVIQLGLQKLWLVTGENKALSITTPPDANTAPVNIVVTGLPQGVTVSPLTLQPGSIGKLVFSATPGAQGGQRTVSVTATSGSLTQSLPLTLIIDEQSPQESADWNNPQPGLVASADYTAVMKSAAQVYNVKGDPYNAKGDGITDDAPAIQKAITDATAAGKSANDGKLRLVYIPSGTYLLKTPASGPRAFGENGYLEIAQADNIGILGDPQTIMLSSSSANDWIQAYSVNKLTIASLVMDSTTRWFTQGTVTQLNAVPNSVDVQIDPGYDDPDPSTRPDLAAVTKLRMYSDPTYMTYDQTLLPTIVSKQQLGPGQWRFVLNASPSADYLGKQALLWPGGARGTGLDLNVIGSVRVTDVQVYPRGGGSALQQYFTYGKSFFGNLLLGRRSGELIGGSGGSFEQNNPGKSTFTHCDISGNDDDGFDFHTLATVVNAQVGSREIVIPAGSAYAVGDTISVIDWVQDEVRNEAKVLATMAEADGLHLVLDRDVTIVRSGAADPPNDPTGKLDRTWDNTVQSQTNLTYNRISSMRARGLLIKGRPGSVIRGNYFHDVPSTALMAAPEFYWSEGPQNVDMRIENNNFVNNSLANIWVAMTTGNSTYSATSYDNRNIRITGNSFNGWGRHQQPYVTGIYGPAVAVDNTDGVKVMGNTFGVPDPALPANYSPLQFGVSKNCTVSGNTGVENDPSACTH